MKIAKGLFAKKCARKIVNCYRVFAELREALAGDRALDEAKDFIASSAPGHKHLRQFVLVVQFLFEASDLATEVTPKASSTCENHAQGAQRRSSTKRALFSDHIYNCEVYRADYIGLLVILLPDGYAMAATARVIWLCACVR